MLCLSRILFSIWPTIHEKFLFQQYFIDHINAKKKNSSKTRSTRLWSALPSNYPLTNYDQTFSLALIKQLVLFVPDGVVLKFNFSKRMPSIVGKTTASRESESESWFNLLTFCDIVKIWPINGLYSGTRTPKKTRVYNSPVYFLCPHVLWHHQNLSVSGFYKSWFDARKFSDIATICLMNILELELQKSWFWNCLIWVF